jgi:dihydrofolate synthase/folylpolyglutamate synthase
MTNIFSTNTTSLKVSSTDDNNPDSVNFSELDSIALLNYLALPQQRDRTNRESRGLDKMQALLAFLGNPHEQLNKAIHITGSKGKGSTALTCEAFLQKGGCTTGTFTSPHLSHWCERYRINGAAISTEEFENIFTGIREYCQQHPHDLPSFSETLTSAALVLFAAHNVDVSIIEVGMGGRLDPSNVIEAEVAVITSIEREHTEILGNSLVEIATEKAGIIKRKTAPHSPQSVLVGNVHRDTLPIFAKTAYQHQANLMVMGKSLKIKQLAEGWRLITPDMKLDLPNSTVCKVLTLAHQRNNTALAIAAVLALDSIEPENILLALTQALTELSLPGRLDWRESEGKPNLLIDAAHTAASINALSEFWQLKSDLNNSTDKHRLIVSLANNKSPLKVIEPLLSLVDNIVICCPSQERSIPAIELQEALANSELLKADTQLTICDNIADIGDFLSADNQQFSTVICTGSTYLAGAIYRYAFN